MEMDWSETESFLQDAEKHVIEAVALQPATKRYLHAVQATDYFSDIAWFNESLGLKQRGTQKLTYCGVDELPFSFEVFNNAPHVVRFLKVSSLEQMMHKESCEDRSCKQLWD